MQGDPLTTDQRGDGYPRILNGNVDIGAYELLATTYLVVTTQPPPAVAIGAPFGLTVAVEDVSGHVDTSFNGAVGVALASSPGPANLGGTLTVQASSGLAVFSDLTIDQTGSGYSLFVSAEGFSDATTNLFEVTPAAVALSMIVPPPQEVTAGDLFSLSVAAIDADGNVVVSYNDPVTVEFDGDYPNTVVQQYTISAQNGVATFNDLRLDTAGSYSFKVSSGSLVPLLDGSIFVIPLPPTHDQIQITESPSWVMAGTPFVVSVQVVGPQGVDGSYSGWLDFQLVYADGTPGPLAGAKAEYGYAGVFMSADVPAAGCTIVVSGDDYGGGLMTATSPPFNVQTSVMFSSRCPLGRVGFLPGLDRRRRGPPLASRPGERSALAGHQPGLRQPGPASGALGIRCHGHERRGIPYGQVSI